jgi:tetratricopeptide (TPR) repeat protein
MKRLPVFAVMTSSLMIVAASAYTAEEWVDKGVDYSKAGKYASALSCLDEAIDANPDYVPAWGNKGIVLRMIGDFENAVEEYDHILESDPGNAYAWNNKGVALRNLGRYEEAVECYDRALELNPEYVYALNNKGFAYYNMGEYYKAGECYDLAVELNPGYTKGWYNKANVLLTMGDYAEATVRYRKALRLEPENLYTHVFLVICETEAGGDTERVTANALASENKEWPYDVVRFYAGEITADVLIAAAGDDPGKLCEAHCYAGFSYKFQGDVVKAKEHFQASVDTERVGYVEYFVAGHELTLF